MTAEFRATKGGMGRAKAKKYKCPNTEQRFDSELECAIHLLKTEYLVYAGELRQQLQMCEVDDEEITPSSSSSSSVLTPKEQKAFDILVEAVRGAKKGIADPSKLRALQPLLPKGTLKKFVNRNTNTFKIVEGSGNNAGWGISFAEEATHAKRSQPADRLVSQQAIDARLLTFFELFAEQEHTECHTLVEPLSKQQIVLSNEEAIKHGLHCHLLAHRVVVSRYELTAAAINRQAAFADFLFDEKMQTENQEIRSFFTDESRPSLLFECVPNKVFRYCQDLSLAGCGFSVFQLPNGSVKCLKFASKDTSGVLLDDFFARKSTNALRIVRLPQQQVTCELKLPPEIVQRIAQRLSFIKSMVEDPFAKCRTAQAPPLPKLRTQYPVTEAQRQQMRPVREALPVWKHKQEFLDAFRSHRITLLSGATGSGKTTQLPQFILDDGDLPSFAPRIICTQPRRIAAISVAERIAAERGQPVGHEVGYQVRFEVACRDSTRLLFLTPGVLLKKLQDDAALPGVGCIVLDEIHERDTSTDFTMLVVKKLLSSGSMHAKIVLMSATLQAEQFVAYFSSVPQNVAENGTDLESLESEIPVISVEGRTHPVQAFYLEDALAWTGFSVDHLTQRLVRSADTRQDFDTAVQQQVDLLASTMASEAWQVLSTSPKDFFVEFGLESLGDEEVASLELHDLLSVSPLDALEGRRMLVEARFVCSKGHDDEWLQIDIAAEVFDGDFKSARLLQEQTVLTPDPPGPMSNPTMLGDDVFVDQTTDLDLLRAWRSAPTVHYELIAELVEFFHHSDQDGAVLVFLPGLADMLSVEAALQTCVSADSLWVQKCHSGLPSQEQRLVFKQPPNGMRKIVLATNIAESSVTLSDVVFVIDSGLRKEKMFSSEYAASKLTTLAVSQTNAVQRRGRAGRVRPGVCVHLFPRAALTQMQSYPTPEMLRTPLEELCLGVFCLGVSDVELFLQEAMDPPNTESIGSAFAALQQLHCIEIHEGSLKVTVVGQQLANLPVHPSLARLVLIGALFGCLTPAAVIAASLSLKSPFAIPVDGQAQSKLASTRKMLAEKLPAGLRSDHLIFLEVYQAWKDGGDQCCSELGLSRAAIHAIHFATKQLVQRTTSMLQRSFGGESARFADRHCSDKDLLVTAVAAALYPSCAIPQVGKSGFGGNESQQWLTRDGFTAKPHGDSCLKGFQSQSASDGDQGLCSAGFLVFHERAIGHSGHLQFVDCSVTSALPFVITAGAANRHAGGVDLDGWLKVQSPNADTIAAVSFFFKQLIAGVCSGRRILMTDPRVQILNAIVELIRKTPAPVPLKRKERECEAEEGKPLQPGKALTPGLLPPGLVKRQRTA